MKKQRLHLIRIPTQVIVVDNSTGGNGKLSNYLVLGKFNRHVNPITTCHTRFGQMCLVPKLILTTRRDKQAMVPSIPNFRCNSYSIMQKLFYGPNHYSPSNDLIRHLWLPARLNVNRDEQARCQARRLIRSNTSNCKTLNSTGGELDAMERRNKQAILPRITNFCDN